MSAAGRRRLGSVTHREMLFERPDSPSRTRRVPDRPRPSGPAAVAFAVLAVLYLATRIAFSARFPYFVDEGTYADFANRAAGSYHQAFASLGIGREPLYIWFAVPLIKLGVNPLDALRVISILAGLATLAVVGELGRRIGGAAVGFVAAALCVLSPFFLVHNGIGIMESQVTLVMASALLVQISLARHPSLQTGLVLGLVLAAGLLTKENTKPALVLIPLSLLVLDFSEPGRRERLRTWGGAVVLAVALAVTTHLALHLSSYWPALVRARSSPFYTVRRVGDVLKDPFASWGTAWHAYRPALVSYVTLPVFAASLAGLVLLIRAQRRLGLLLLGWVLLPTLIAFSFAALPFPRHVMYLVPPFLVLAALALVAAARLVSAALGPRRAVAALAVAGALVASQSLVVDARVLADPVAARYPGLDEFQYVTGDGGGEPWPKLEDALRRRAGSGRVVILHPTTDANVIRLMLRKDHRFVFVDGNDPRAPQARFGIFDASPIPDVPALRILKDGRYREVARFPRPHGGKTVRLWERVR